MKQVAHGDYLLVQVPKGASGFELWKPFRLTGKWTNPGVGYNHPDPAQNWDEQQLPEGNWQIVGKADELNEAQLIEMLGEVAAKAGIGMVHLLCASNGLQPETTLILKNVTDELPSNR